MSIDQRIPVLEQFRIRFEEIAEKNNLLNANVTAAGVCTLTDVKRVCPCGRER